MTPEETRAALEWAAGDDTGASSKTLWAVMMGVPCAYPSIPYDVDDFGRCYRLIKEDEDATSRLAALGRPADRLLLAAAPLTQQGRLKVIAQGVPLPMGRAIARAVRRALDGQ